MEILELKSTTNSPEGLISRYELAKERLSKLENKLIEIIV